MIIKFSNKANKILNELIEQIKSDEPEFIKDKILDVQKINNLPLEVSSDLFFAHLLFSLYFDKIFLNYNLSTSMYSFCGLHISALMTDMVDLVKVAFEDKNNVN